MADIDITKPVRTKGGLWAGGLRRVHGNGKYFTILGTVDGPYGAIHCAWNDQGVHYPKAPEFDIVNVEDQPAPADKAPGVTLSVPPLDRQGCLDAAGRAVLADRSNVYGPPEDNFRRIAAIWSVVLGVDVSAAQVAACMIGVKLARLAQSPGHGDSWVDAAGYAACGAEVSGGEQ